jgi:hypothetical protein
MEIQMPSQVKDFYVASAQKKGSFLEQFARVDATGLHDEDALVRKRCITYLRTSHVRIKDS